MQGSSPIIRRHRAFDGAQPRHRGPKSIAAAASEYAEMCTSCHFAPGLEDNKLRPGLYPHPPDLADHRHDAEQDPLAAHTSAGRQLGNQTWDQDNGNARLGKNSRRRDHLDDRGVSSNPADAEPGTTKRDYPIRTPSLRAHPDVRCARCRCRSRGG
jgi:hypothetical protein